MRKHILPVLFCIYAGSLPVRAEPTPTPTPTPTATLAPAPVALDPVFASQNLWETPAQDFVALHKEAGFRWASSAQDTAESSRPMLTLFNIHVDQIVARFTQGKLHEITVLFYNRGDSGELWKNQFDALVKQSVDAISDCTKVKFTVRGKDAANAVRAYGLIWQTDRAQFLLEYSFTRTPDISFRAEFVRLTVAPLEKPKGLLEESFAAAQPVAKFSGVSHVKTNPAGDVFIGGIPMVDQGEKGYCVVASAERVMRYYGKRVDENELAQIANSDAEKGTSLEAMFDSLKKLGSRLRVKVRTVEAFDENRFNAMINAYNLAARRGRRVPEIDPRVESLKDVFEQMNPDILRETRTKNRSETERFFRFARSRVDQGIPLLWSVMIGILPQPKEPKGSGGHMRLIIGYNAKTNEILYSDSWGFGHEMKRMPLADAWTMTTGLYTIEPL